jgi:hypothetical protein
MNFAAADEIVKAVLYEGYVLYPYRPTAIKNRQRWTFGGVYPVGCESAGAAQLETQCLIEGDANTRIEARVRFLQPMARQIGELPASLGAWQPADGEPEYRAVPSLQCNGRTHYTWEEALERELHLPVAALGQIVADLAPVTFAFPASRTFEPIIAADTRSCGLTIRNQVAISARVSLEASAVRPGVYRLIVRVDNTTALPSPVSDEKEAARLRGFMSTHVILGAEDGAFISLIDPPAQFAEAAHVCTNRSAWPVLVGAEGSRDTLLCSPIILYDHPQIAPESPGDLFDGTEIDEILTLRILAMTDAEKQEMIATDERARALLARTEALTPEQMQQLHGVMRSPRAAVNPLEAIAAQRRLEAALPRLASLNQSGVALKVGDQVRLNPKSGGDILDLALAGQIALIEAIEIDFENRIHVAVTLNDDPGRDLGMERMPGHRFFFSPEELECLPDTQDYR